MKPEDMLLRRPSPGDHPKRYAMSGKIRDVKHILRPGLRSLWSAREEDHGIQAYDGIQAYGG